MKITITILALTIVTFVNAQNSNTFERKWIKNDNYKMIFYSIKDTIKTVIGEIENKLEINQGIIIQSMTFKSKMFKNDFVDVTEYHLSNLKPIFHTSNNDQRFLTVVYGDTIHAIYRNASDKRITSYVEIINNKLNYFESSTYQNIIRWLPLKEGYTNDIAIYNYDPNSRTGIFNVKITQVISEKYKTMKSGVRDVWKVTELYENLNTVHYIDKEDRKIWKQEVNGGKMVMLRVE
ncbi:MAG: hypothetical protein SFU27_12645 [Thermonemataceae bacterium]|nr:hypothetical protein [Thermonemataceae bacterium]